MLRKKFVYFDIGGVLMDFSTAMYKVAERHQVSLEDFQRVYDKYGHAAERGDITLQDVWKKYEEELGIKADDSFDFLDYWIDELHPITENHKALLDIAQSHPVGILSNMYIDAIPIMIEKGKIPNATYTTIIESSEVRYIKPEEQIYQLAEKASAYSPSDIIYIDDRPDFVNFAKTLGWNGIWYTTSNGVNLKDELSKFLS